MRKNIVYQDGQLIGECKYLYEVETRVSSIGFKYRYAMFKCLKCGNKFESAIQSVKRGNTKSCGCYQKLRASQCNAKHRMSGGELYPAWSGMKDRCYNKLNPRFKNYGGRGIKVCDEWRSDFKAYYDYMISLPNYGKNGMTLDRKDNNGNYEPNNMRWASPHLQQANHNLHKNNKTGFKGVALKYHGRYSARLTRYYKEYHVGYFDTALDAAKARNKFVIDNEFEVEYLNQL